MSVTGPIHGALLRYISRRHALPCALCSVMPILVGLAIGKAWPDYRAQADTLMKLKSIGGLFKQVQELMRSDLLPIDSVSFFFQFPFAHPATILALILSVALPTLALPATARKSRALDLLLATGLTRRQLVVTTSLFTLPFAALLGFAPLAGSWLGGLLSGIADELPMRAFVRVSIEATLLGLFFAGLAQLLSVLAADLFGASWRLAAIVLWSLAAEIVGTLWQDARFLKYLTPFGYYEPAQVIAGVAHYGRDCAVLGGAALAFFVAALLLEERRKSA